MGAGGAPPKRPARPHVSDFDWLVGQLTKVNEWGRAAGRLHPGEFHNYGTHTALKLSALNHALDVFTPIARRQADEGRRYGRSVYVDLFAGCGVTQTPKGAWLAGSPLIAAHAKARFDAMVLVEKGSRRLNALKDRMAAAGVAHCPVPDYLGGDCNARVADVLQLLRPNDLVFVCVDPEGMEIQWDTIRQIVAACPSSDLFINFTSGVDRVRAVAAESGVGGATLAQFTGRTLAETLRKTGDGSAVLELYEGNLGSELGKPYGTASEVVGSEGSSRYHILIRTRKTSRDSPYREGYNALERRLKGVDASQAGRALEIVLGHQAQLGQP